MSYSEEHNYKKGGKAGGRVAGAGRGRDGAGDTSSPSPASSEVSLPSPVAGSSPGSNSSPPGHTTSLPIDLMSVLSPGLADLPL